MRILIYGAGVIGSLYAALFSEAGYDVSVFARGRRLKELEKKGLLYLKGKRVQRADVPETGADPIKNVSELLNLFLMGSAPNMEDVTQS